MASSTTSGTRCATVVPNTSPDPMRDLNLTVPDFPYGSPCWVDLLVSDVARAKSFYSDLFGWTWLAGDPATGGYTMALLAGQPVAGLSRKPADAPIPSQWTTYLRIGDIEVAGEAIRAHGGRVLGRPVSLGALARTQIAVDPGGAYFGIWEPGDLPGSGVLDEPGSLTWNELLTRDYDRVQYFQSRVFGHEFTDETEAGGPRWSTAHTGDGNPAYGLAEIDGDWPREIPAHWVTSFATHHVVPSLARALELGATLIQGPFDGPYGVGALLAGPEGEVFSILVPDLD
jgi:predicted enzyme related to lactoylglutathione lyase